MINSSSQSCTNRLQHCCHAVLYLGSGGDVRFLGHDGHNGCFLSFLDQGYEGIKEELCKQRKVFKLQFSPLKGATL